MAPPAMVFGEQFVALSPLVLMIFYFFGVGFTIANYSGYFRFHSDIYGDDFNKAYLTFTVLGTIAYFIWCGPFWLWAAKYSNTASERSKRVCIGVGGILLFHDLPIFIMEYHAILCCGWLNGYQGFVFVFQHIEFLVSFSFGWLSYAYVMAGILQKQSYFATGGPPELKTGAVQLHILPAMNSNNNNGYENDMLQTPVLTDPQPVPQPVQFPNAAAAFSPRDRQQGAWSGAAYGGSGRQFAFDQPPLPSSERGGRASSQRGPSGHRNESAASPASSARPIPLRENLGESGSEDEEAQDMRFVSRVAAPSYSPAAERRYANGVGASPTTVESYANRGPVIVIPTESAPQAVRVPYQQGYHQQQQQQHPSSPLGSIFVDRAVI